MTFARHTGLMLPKSDPFELDEPSGCLDAFSSMIALAQLRFAARDVDVDTGAIGRSFECALRLLLFESAGSCEN